MIATFWNRADLAAAADALAVHGDDPAVVQAAQAARLKALDAAAWLALGDIGRKALADNLADALSDAALDRLAKDLGVDLDAMTITWVDDDGTERR